jgi:hypothetical protein
MSVVAIVRIPLNEAMSSEDVRSLAEGMTDRYKEAPGLVRKYFIRGRDGMMWGGVYLWETQADGEAVFSDAWQERVEAVYGNPPIIEWFDAALVLDNLHDEVVVG